MAAASNGEPPRRVEFLAVSWDSETRGDTDASAAVRALARITLPSIPPVRRFANEVLSDVAMYEQASHRQSIHSHVIRRINELLCRWHVHNPSFDGQVVLCGHSLGAVIAFDILQQADPSSPADSLGRLANPPSPPPAATTPPDFAPSPAPSPAPEPASRRFFFAESAPALAPDGQHGGELTAPDGPGPGGSTSQPATRNVKFSALVALGSPVGYFVVMRHRHLGPAFTLRPLCDRVFNVFAKHDPVAYRLEPLLSPDAAAAADGDGSAGVGGESPSSGGGGTPAESPSRSSRLPSRPLPRPWDAPPQDVARANRNGVLAGAETVGRAVANPAVALASGAMGMASKVQGLFGMGRKEGDEDGDDDGADEPAFALNDGERVDWMLQEAEFGTVQHVYAQALAAHACYFRSEDVAAFIVNAVVGGGRPASEAGGKAPTPPPTPSPTPLQFLETC